VPEGIDHRGSGRGGEKAVRIVHAQAEGGKKESQQKGAAHGGSALGGGGADGMRGHETRDWQSVKAPPSVQSGVDFPGWPGILQGDPWKPPREPPCSTG
jgi:hypothetical protein